MNKEQFLIDMKEVYDIFEGRWNVAIDKDDRIEESNLRGTMSIMATLINEIESGKYDCDYKILMSNK